MEKRAEDQDDTRQTLHDLMGRRWKVSLLTGPLTIRQTVQARDDGTLATVVWALDRGASIVRVHAARPSVEAVQLLTAMRQLDVEAVA